MKHLLIARLSALGDVAMTVPVVVALAAQYPQLHITVLSRAGFRPLFEGLAPNITFLGVDLKHQYKGLCGLRRLSADLPIKRFTAFADLHDVLRTKYLCFCFRLAGVPVARLRKNRAGRKALTRAVNKCMEPQGPVFERYADVLARLGYPVRLDFESIFGTGRKGDLSMLPFPLEPKAENRWVGIAPFAAHRGKVYPLERMERVVAALSARSGLRVFLFGAGDKERRVLENWQKQYPRTLSVAGKLGSMRDELILMSHLDVMLSMDSANMHLASLVHTPVVSVWGATHPYAGFMGWNQQEANALQADLPCRPCSVYGNRPCRRKDYACMLAITPEQIVQRLAVVARFLLS